MSRLMLLAVFLATPALGQVASDPSLAFDKVEAMVPMRDGVRLRTQVYVPKGAKEKLPVLFMRTPYGFSPDAKGFSLWLARPWLAAMLRDGYIVALQSVRGRFGSEGRFVIEPPFRDRRDPKSTDEGTDCHDTVDWLLARFATNGRVGLLGVSNPARLVAMAMREPHPAVRAYSPQATPADNWMGDDFFHGGVFRLSMIEFVHAMESSPEFTEYRFDRTDLYDFFLQLGPLSSVESRFLAAPRPSWTDFRSHPSYDAYWRAHSLPLVLDRPPAPILQVGGAFDQEDRRGPVALHRALEAKDTRGWNTLVVGPWAHRTWRFDEGDRLGRIDFGSATARFFREEVQAPFFACQLKDRCGPPLPKALVFQTGSNVWQRLPAWPPRGAPQRSLYLRADGRLAFEPPGDGGAEEADAWVSDPAHPVPSQPRPIVARSADEELHEKQWATSLVQDQRFVDGRPDVLTWTRPSRSPRTWCSPARWPPTSSSPPPAPTPTSWPSSSTSTRRPGRPSRRMGGFELMVTGEILRGRYRRELRDAGALHRRQGRAARRGPAHRQPRLQEGPPHHAAGPLHLVPDLRAQPADLGAQRLRGQGGGLQGADPPGLPVAPVPVARHLRRRCGEGMNARATRNALAAIALWGALAALSVRLRDVPPFLLVGISLLVGSVFGLRHLSLRALRPAALLLGVYGLFAYHFCLFTALRLAPPVEANLINYLWPLLIVVLSPVVIPGARLDVRHVVGALAGFSGAALLVTGGRLGFDQGALAGELLALAAAFIWATYSLLSRRLGGFPPATISAFCLVSGALSLACHGLFEPRYTLRLADAPPLLAIGLGPMGAAFHLWDRALKEGDPRVIGALAYLTPLLSTLLLALFGGGRLGPVSLAAMALIVGGALVGTWRPATWSR